MISTRLWHYKLIPVLPKKMLVSQWRECIAIKRQWEKGTLKHRSVSYVMNYHKSTFRAYVMSIVGEMNKRKIKYQYKYYDEILEWAMDENYLDIVYYPEHNSRYLKQCFCNLQEKYDRGIINSEEWSIIIQEIYWQIEKEGGNE